MAAEPWLLDNKENDMSAELIAILTVGVALGATMLATMRGLRVELGDLRSDVGDLRERMARLEGLFEGFTRSGGQEGSAA